MKKTKLLCVLGCAAGGGLIGFFAGKLDSALGILLFSAGVLLLTLSAYKAAK